jgi:NADPH-dependent glutamate synthase beta subunit-like oxidoreductase
MSLCYELSGESSNDEGGDGEAAIQRLERHDLFVTRADTVLRPLFRYCQYELKQAGKSTMEEPRLMGATANQQQGVTSEDEDSIVFRDQELVLDNKDLRVLLLKLQSVEQEQKDEAQKKEEKSETKETQFITSLSIIDDAIEVVQSLEQELSKAASSSGPAVQAKLQQYTLWRGYLQ